ncbi:unnamed protein product, partial [Mycena citricolor]
PDRTATLNPRMKTVWLSRQVSSPARRALGPEFAKELMVSHPQLYAPPTVPTWAAVQRSERPVTRCWLSSAATLQDVHLSNPVTRYRSSSSISRSSVSDAKVYQLRACLIAYLRKRLSGSASVRDAPSGRTRRPIWRDVLESSMSIDAPAQGGTNLPSRKGQRQHWPLNGQKTHMFPSTPAWKSTLRFLIAALQISDPGLTHSSRRASSAGSFSASRSKPAGTPMTLSASSASRHTLNRTLTDPSNAIWHTSPTCVPCMRYSAGDDSNGCG